MIGHDVSYKLNRNDPAISRWDSATWINILMEKHAWLSAGLIWLQSASDNSTKLVTKGEHPLRRKHYQNNSVKLILCNCPRAVTGFLCRASEKNSPNMFSCKSRSLSRNNRDYGEKGLLQDTKKIPQKFYCVIAPGVLTGFSCRAPENNSKIIFLPVIILTRRVWQPQKR